MSTHVDALRLRRVLGRSAWSPPEPFGPDGWRLTNVAERASVIVTASDGHDDTGRWFTHASIARADRMPDYDDLVLLHKAVWGDNGHAYQVFVPASEHVNIHEHALHLWGLTNGSPLLPEFGLAGSI